MAIDFSPYSSYYFFNGSTRYFGLSLYNNENDFQTLCTYERRTTYRSLSPRLNYGSFILSALPIIFGNQSSRLSKLKLLFCLFLAHVGNKWAPGGNIMVRLIKGINQSASNMKQLIKNQIS